MPRKTAREKALNSGERSNCQASHKEVIKELQKYISSPRSKTVRENWTFGELLLRSLEDEKEVAK